MKSRSFTVLRVGKLDRVASISSDAICQGYIGGCARDGEQDPWPSWLSFNRNRAGPRQADVCASGHDCRAERARVAPSRAAIEACGDDIMSGHLS